MNTQQSIEKLFAQLDQLSQYLLQLSGILEREQTALTQDDLTDLEALARDKEKLSEKIDELEHQRYSLYQHLNINADFNSVQTYLNGISAKLLPRLSRQWDQINELGSQCASQNQVNGILLAHRQRHTQQALSILRGSDGDEELYSSNGSQQVIDSQHSLGRV